MFSLTYPDSKPIKYWATHCTACKLDKSRHAAYPGNLVHIVVLELVCGIVLLQNAKARCETEAGEEDAEAAKNIEPGYEATVWSGA